MIFIRNFKKNICIKILKAIFENFTWDHKKLSKYFRESEKLTEASLRFFLSNFFFQMSMSKIAHSPRAWGSPSEL